MSWPDDVVAEPKALPCYLRPMRMCNSVHDQVSFSWVPRVVYIGIRPRVMDLKSDLFASNILIYSHSSELVHKKQSLSRKFTYYLFTMISIDKDSCVVFYETVGVLAI